MDKSCRICRGDGTEAQPLLHPCKCRGSIKYIHQDCLLEWLKHSNKSTKQCDICHTPYKFRTIYDPQMPERMPIKLVWEKLAETYLAMIIKSLSIFLYVTCLLIQVPIFWKFAGRIYTWAIDGTLPAVNPTLKDALMFGGLNMQEYETTGPTMLLLLKTRMFFDYTYFSGVRYMLTYVVIHIALFVEHEWVVRDEGYTKLLLKRIGKQPRTKLVDMLQQALSGLRQDGADGNRDANANIQHLEMIARAINDLQEHPTNNYHEEALRRAIEGGVNDLSATNDQAGNSLLANESRDFDSDASETEADNEGTTIFLPSETSVGDTNNGRGLVEDEEEENEERGNEHLDDELLQPPPLNPMPFPDIDQGENNLFNGDFVQEEPDDIDAGAAANNAGNGNLFELLGMSLNLSTPFILMAMCDTIIAIYLFLTYLIPHMLGNLFVSIIRELIKFVFAPILSEVSSLLSIRYDILGFISKFGILQRYRTTIGEIFSLSVATTLGQPLLKTFYNLFIDHNGSPPTLVERTILLSFGYSIILFGVLKFMDTLVSTTGPTTGTPRKIYKVLFEAVSTAKVFLIFAIEIFFFPVYCGWLLDFCMAPLLISKFFEKVNDNDTYKIMMFVSSQAETLQVTYIRIIVYWASGTLYMLFFALFVGMVRGKILRPGVLFFIRSPDDPNARLIHDALVKPLSLQLSRIYLSAKVYTAFILIGIGGITWGLRYLVTPPKGIPYNILLPFNHPSIFAYSLASLVGGRILMSKALITKYSLYFWRRVFELSSHKLRLSHFILDKQIPLERGYVVYRNILQMVFGTSEPDYSNPVTYRESQKIFKENPDVNACFVPNGTYVRVPDNDTVSRRFIKKLFVPVTRDDKLLSPKDETNTNNIGEEHDSDSSDNDVSNDDAYTIVYRAPNFKLRCLALIVMLWIFAALLILIMGLVALVMGRPIVRAGAILYDIVSLSEHFKLPDIFDTTRSTFDWRLADLSSISLGLMVELTLLKLLDKMVFAPASNNGGNEVPGAANQQGIFDDAREWLPVVGDGVLTSVFAYCLSTFLWIVWIFLVHKLCIDFPARLYTGNTFERESNIFSDFLITGRTVPIHLVVSIWTMVPYLNYLIAALKYAFVEGAEGVENRNHLIKSDLISVALDFSLIIVPSLVLMALNHKSFVIEHVNEGDIYIWFISLLIFACIKSIKGVFKLFRNMSEKVKVERYVRGRAVENIDIQYDNNDDDDD
ncbi:uncharacterized protein PRCAT00003981001 [Priceomyces carsonii]|uniref:uncharacterized protein n=1 Tax=Priceomyces carsonii TaxID=28549 RepID=UPI002ED8D6DB|nr:unnamed protein product [Priceomyces carsonii]